MDTQGTFDPTTAHHDNVMIFSMATILSSMQIYNLMHNIQENDIQNLQLYTEYGRIVSSTQTSVKPFQSLTFMVRDWQFNYESPYGFQGGSSYLDELLEITHDQPAELHNVRHHIRSSFDLLNCCLLPHPGRHVQTDPNFNGKLSEIDREFLTVLKQVVPTMLRPDKVLTKKVNGTELKAKDFVGFLRMCWQSFNSTTIPTARSIYNITVEYNNLTARNEVQEFYISQFPYLDEVFENEEIREWHEQCVKEAFNIFTMKTRFGEPVLREPHLNMLTEFFNTQLLHHLAANDAKRTANLAERVNELELNCSREARINQEQRAEIEDAQIRMRDIENRHEMNRRSYRRRIRNLRNQDSDASDSDHLSLSSSSSSVSLSSTTSSSSSASAASLSSAASSSSSASAASLSSAASSSSFPSAASLSSATSSSASIVLHRELDQFETILRHVNGGGLLSMPNIFLNPRRIFDF